MLSSLNIVLVRLRFPENLGMVARACANMGCKKIHLVQPARWNMKKSEKLATKQAFEILQDLQIHSSLNEAIKDSNHAYGLTARTGGWRKNMVSPEKAAEEIIAGLEKGQRISLVLGSEDCGLNNEEISLCTNLVHIKTSKEGKSLNLAMAAVIMLYECFKKAAPKKYEADYVSLDKLCILEKKLKYLLNLIDCHTRQNYNYYFMAWHRLLSRMQLHKHEYDILMGFLRKIENRMTVIDNKNILNEYKKD